MFCSKCGTQIADNSKFCGNCGTKTNNVSTEPVSSVRNMELEKIKFDTSTVINIVIATVMVLIMLLLPMFELRYDNNGRQGSYTISLLGDNYMAGHSIRDDIITFSRIAFVFMVVSIIAVVVFKHMRRTRFALISSIVNLSILLIYDVYVNNTWMSEEKSYYEHSTVTCVGNIICIGCAVALVILSYRDYRICTLSEKDIRR